jgi:hypothetical protein
MTEKNYPEEQESIFCPEELEFQTWESEIGFENIKTRDLTDHVLSTCRREVIPESDFLKVLTFLKIPLDSQTRFKRFQEKNGYSLQKLLFSAILIGKGSNEDKLFSFFSFVDLHGTSFLSKHDLINAIKDLVNLSTSASVGESVYSASLVKLRPLAISKLIHELCVHDQCSQAQLRDLLNAKDCWFLFNSKNLRAWIRNLNLAVPVKLTEESTGLPVVGGVRVNTESVTSSVSVVSEVLPDNVREEPLSSSSDSNGPICLQVNLSPREQASFYFYPSEDPVRKVVEFSKEHNLSPAYKDRLLQTVTKLKNQVV